MIDRLLHKEVQDFICHNEMEDEKKLVLKHSTVFGIPTHIIAEQISGRRKAKSKLPLYYNTRGILYPPGLNLEQSSSEKTACFKAEILSALPKHETLADVTGGFGIDTFFLNKIFKEVHHVEPNATLHQIAQHNHNALKASGIIYHNRTVADFLMSLEQVDCIFIDPSRRSAGQKVFRLTDCEPPVIELLSFFFKHTEYVLVKTSPLLDIQQGKHDLQCVEKVWVVAVDNECKELLFLCHKGFSGEPEITAVNLQNNREVFSFTGSEEKNSEPVFSEPLEYIYEPNAALLKAGAFKLICKKFSVLKLHPSTHLYTSAELIENFPGRVFKNLQQVKPDPKTVSGIFNGKANIITRNYPLTVEALKKKTRLKDGGTRYLLGFSGQTEKYLVAAERLK